MTPAQRNDIATILTVLASAHDDRPGYGFAFRRMFYEQFYPDAPLAYLQELDRIIVGRFSGAVAHAYAAELCELDQTALASRLAVPALVGVKSNRMNSDFEATIFTARGFAIRSFRSAGITWFFARDRRSAL